MLRFLLLFALVFFALRLFSRPAAIKRPPNRPKAKARDDYNAQGTLVQQTLMACPACGTYFNPSQGVRAHSKTYCNEKCASLDS